MKYTILALLASSLMLHTTSNQESDDQNMFDLFADLYQMYLIQNAERLTPAELKAKYISWDMFCFELREDADCTGVSAPNVMTFRPNPLRPGLAGYYPGGDTVYIRNNIRGSRREEVLTHEMSHYYDVERDMTNVPGYAKEICFSEKRAWSVSDNYWIKYGWSSRAVGTSWTEWYTYCTKYQSILYPDVYGE